MELAYHKVLFIWNEIKVMLSFCPNQTLMYRWMPEIFGVWPTVKLEALNTTCLVKIVGVFSLILVI
jgi:hypothetical protein